MLIMGFRSSPVDALDIGQPVRRAQEEGFDPSPIGYELAARQGARVGESFTDNCVVVVQFHLPRTHRGAGGEGC